MKAKPPADHVINEATRVLVNEYLEALKKTTVALDDDMAGEDSYDDRAQFHLAVARQLGALMVDHLSFAGYNAMDCDDNGELFVGQAIQSTSQAAVLIQTNGDQPRFFRCFDARKP